MYFYGHGSCIVCNVIKQTLKSGTWVQNRLHPLFTLVLDSIPYFPISSYKKEENTHFQNYQDYCILK